MHERARERARAPQAKAQAPYAGSRRFYRGRIVLALTHVAELSLLDLGGQVKEGFGESDLPWLEKLLEGLRCDGLVAVDRCRETARLP